MLTRLRHAIDSYAAGKDWRWYVVPLLFATYLFFQILDFSLGQPESSFFVLIAQSLDFFLHEMAHLVTAFLPQILVALAGSAAELLLGITLIITAFLVRSYFASVFCFLWFMLATQSVADYIGDARAQNLELVSFGGSDPIHDWHFILSKLGWLPYDSILSQMVRGIGVAAGVFGLLFSAWIITRIAHVKAEAARQKDIDVAMNKIAAKRPEERANEPFVDTGLYPTATTGPLATRPSRTAAPTSSAPKQPSETEAQSRE